MINEDSDYSIFKAEKAREAAILNSKTFVLTNGCFDIMHAGHAYSLKKAAEYGDYLWVGLNSDSSIQKFKGAERPIVSEINRAYLVASLRVVSGVFIFNQQNLSEEIELLKPDIYVKSADYTIDTINSDEKRSLNKVGAKINFVPLIEQLSSTSIITKIKDLSPYNSK
jgi:glycerol-3-phosphate cytidylyltransferase